MRSIWDKSNDYYTLSTLNDEMILEAEQILGVKLPDSYIKLVREQNGGSLLFDSCPTTVPTSWADDHVNVHCIMGIGEEGILSSSFYINEWELPEGLVLLCGEGHWWIALDYRNTKENPPVIFVDSEWGQELFILELAKDFTEFINKLY